VIYSEPLFIAEISCNHRGSLNRALLLIDMAVEAGAGAIKFQTWASGKMVADKEYIMQSGPWVGRNLYALYEEAWTPWEWHGELFARCHAHGVPGFSTVFDIESLRFLEEQHNCPMYKISSFECIDLALARAVAQTGKPLLISTGMTSWLELDNIVNNALNAGCTDLTVLHCVSAYSAQPEDCHLRTITTLQKRWPECKIGWSDHTQGAYISLAAIALGATVIERHFTDDKSSLDGEFSLNPDEFLSMVATGRRIYAALGNANKERSQAEADMRQLRRSLYVIKDIKAGEELTTDNIATRRPADGLHPFQLGCVLGCQAITDLLAGTPLRALMVKSKSNER
jgi:N-acetylneuraminate synthase